MDSFVLIVFDCNLSGKWKERIDMYSLQNNNNHWSNTYDSIEQEQNDFKNFRKKTRFWFYDLLMLDVLSTHNHLGSKLFSKLFQRNSLKNVFRFLDEETSFIEDLKIMLSMPPFRFVLALFKRVLNIKH